MNEFKRGDIVKIVQGRAGDFVGGNGAFTDDFDSVYKDSFRYEKTEHGFHEIYHNGIRRLAMLSEIELVRPRKRLVIII